MPLYKKADFISSDRNVPTHITWTLGPGGAAELLGMKPTTLAYRMKKLSLRRPR